MDHLSAIQLSSKSGTQPIDIARKIYLCYPTKAFINLEEKQYEIIDEICRFFQIDFTCIQIAGSAKTGRSPHKDKDFIPGKSDLDIAIINPQLFIKYMELVFIKTKGYSDLTSLPMKTKRNVPTIKFHKEYLSKGMFFPDAIPYGPERAEWFDFFSKLSDKHQDQFKSINAVIYISESLFVEKQTSAIKKYTEKGLIL